MTVETMIYGWIFFCLAVVLIGSAIILMVRAGRRAWIRYRSRHPRKGKMIVRRNIFDERLAQLCEANPEDIY